MSRRALAAAVVIALIACVAWWGTETPAPETPSSAPPKRAVVEPVTIARDIAASKRRVESGDESAAAASPVPSSTDSRPSDGPPPQKRTLVVRTIDGDPIVGARISARLEGRTPDRDAGGADSAGRAEFVVEADERIVVAAEGYVPRWIRDDDVVVVLKRPTQVEGRVVDAQGRPIAGAGARNDRSPSPSVSSDENGRFRIDVDPDDPDVGLVVSRDGFLTWEGERRPGDLDVLVALCRPGSIEGRLVLPDGRAAPHGEVNDVESDGDGAFVLGPLSAGEHVLSASAEHLGRRYAAESIVRLADGETLRGVQMILRESLRSFAAMRVVGPDGVPVTFAYALAERSAGAEGHSGENMVFTVEGPPDREYRVTLFGTTAAGVDYGDLNFDVVTRATPTGAPLVVTLPRIAWLDVEVVRPDRARDDGRSVRLEQTAGPSTHVAMHNDTRPFHFVVAVGGAYRVHVDVGVFAPVVRDVTAEELAAGHATVRLSVGATVRVHVVARPPARIHAPWVVLGADSPAPWHRVPNGGARVDGRYEIEHVRAGKCDARFLSCGSIVEKTLTIDVPEDGVLDLGDVVLAGTTTLKGRVVTPDGRPAGGAELEYFDARRVHPPDGVHAITRVDGTFEFDVPIGATGDLRVSKDELGGVIVPLDGKASWTEVRLQPECRIRIVARATSPRGWDPSVALARPDGTGLWCAPLDGEQRTRDGETVEVRRGLAPGRWVVRLYEETPPLEREVVLVAGETTEVVIDEPK